MNIFNFFKKNKSEEKPLEKPADLAKSTAWTKDAVLDIHSLVTLNNLLAALNQLNKDTRWWFGEQKKETDAIMISTKMIAEGLFKMQDLMGYPKLYGTEPIGSTTNFQLRNITPPPVDFKEKNLEYFVSQLMYVKEKFAQTTVEKNAVDRIINNIKGNGNRN
jgi:hypothetical protein